MPEDEANASGHIATPDLASWHHRDHLKKEMSQIIGAGEAFYVPPGHVPAATTGSEIVQFSPTSQLQAVEAAMAKAMQQMQGA